VNGAGVRNEAFEVLIGIEILIGKYKDIQRADRVIDQVIRNAMADSQAPMHLIFALCIFLRLELPLLPAISVSSTNIAGLDLANVDAGRIEARFTCMTKLLPHPAAII
jgi:hypothetical protein